MPQPSSTSPKTAPPYRRWALLLIVAGLAALFWRLQFLESNSLESAPLSKVEKATEASKDESNETAPIRSDSSTAVMPPPMPSSEIAQVLDEYMVPGKMVFFRIGLDSSGKVELNKATGAAGRAKPAALRETPGYIRIDAFDAANRLTFSQTAEDPTHRVLEHPASSDDGRLTRTVHRQDSGVLFLRIPGESEAIRLELSRWDATSSWSQFAAINLP